MKWMAPAYWLALGDGLRTWLLELEPSFFHANVVLRVVLIFIIVKIFFSLLVGVVRLAVFLVDNALSLIVSAAGRWLIYDFVWVIAPIYVQIQAVALRIMRPAIQNRVLDQSSETSDRPEQMEIILPRPLSVFKSALLAYIAILIIGLPAVLINVLFAVLRSLIRINILSIASAVTTIWLAGLLHLTEIGGNLRPEEIPLSILVAAGTLLALIFVALNTDVRGKAELNKVASVTCRTALHETAPKILRIADALRAIRRLAVKRLVFFPTAPELFELTGRKDLCWRGSCLLPLTANVTAESASPISAKLARLSQLLVDQPRWPYDITRNSIVKEGDILDQYTTLMSQSRAVCDILIHLYESGMADKLNKVLSVPAHYFLIKLFDEKFGVDAADTIHLKGDEHWYDYTLDEDYSAVFQSRWNELASADPHDQHLREACINLNRVLRSTVYNVRSNDWRTAVDEYRLRYLAEAIDSSLRPRLLDRIRQLFDK